MKYTHIVDKLNPRRQLRYLLQEAKLYFWLLAAILMLAIAAHLLDPPLNV